MSDIKDLSDEELELAVEERRVTLQGLQSDHEKLSRKLEKAYRSWAKAHEALTQRKYPRDADLWDPEVFAKVSTEALNGNYAHTLLHDFFAGKGVGFFFSGTMINRQEEFIPVPVLWVAPSEVDSRMAKNINRYHQLVRTAGCLPDDMALLISIRTEDLNRAGIPQLYLNKDGSASFSVTRYGRTEFEVENGTPDEAWEAARRYEDRMRD